MHAALLLLPPLYATSLGAAALPRQEAEQNAGIEVRGAGEPFATLVTEGAPFPYVYPLFAPGGMAVTRGFPMDPKPGEAHDHPHHRSMWIAHGDVNGVDFWHGGERPGTIVTDAHQVSAGRDVTQVRLELRWLDDAGEELLQEVREYLFRDGGDTRSIDVASEYTALAKTVVFGDTKEGTFALRLHAALRLQGEVALGRARDSEGHTDKDVWGKRARWVHYAGTVEREPVGVAIFDHPANPRHPTWWHARDYGLFAANPFGAHDFEGAPPGSGELSLARDETVAFRYRVLLHRGEQDTVQLERAFARFAQSE